MSQDRGSPAPLGVTPGVGGSNVAVVSRNATRVFLCVFAEDTDLESYRFALPQRLGDVHYGFIEGLLPGMRYGLRAEGPWDPGQGHRFDVSKLLLDPYATALDRPFAHDPALTERGRETADLAPKCIIEEVSHHPHEPHWTATPRLIYELQVKSFTMLHPDVPEEKRGKIAALAEPVVIDHLLKLGVDAVELMPLMAWIDERHLPPLGLANAWGYNPVSFMAPEPRLAPGGLAEIRMVTDALRAAGIRSVLDAVFNHTGESDELGATLSLRGLDNALYYAHANGRLANHSGCGNTLALGRAPVVRLAMDSLRSWVTKAGIDGFRFDLATVMGRGGNGFDVNAPLLSAIEQDPLLSSCQMIAEPWDVGPEGYRLGGFPPRWLEWNDRYRDTVRRFWNGSESAGALATRIAGSSDVFAPHRRPSCSINYLAAHDGFTLRDAVTYQTKNNHANGEDNRDGSGHDPTWPGGDARAMLATLFLSRGTPMLTAGDEFGRSQQGNNNAYAQDNPITWLDWDKADRELIEFTARLSKLRRDYPLLTDDRFLAGMAGTEGELPDAQWLGADGEAVQWHDGKAPALGLLLARDGQRIALWFNRGESDVAPVLPQRDGWAWPQVFCSGDGDGFPARSVALHAERRVRQAGVSDETLRALAAEAGIERDWWEVDGTHHDVTPDTLRAVLAALRIPHATAEDTDQARKDLRQRPRPLVTRQGEVVEVFAAAPQRRCFIIADETGNRHLEETAAGQEFSHAFAPGIHQVWSVDDPEQRQTVIVSPGSCYMPEDIAGGHRVWGLAAHLYSLRHRGDGGIGDLETLRRFGEITASLGGRYAGLNPLHHLFPTDRSRASPYQPSDRRHVDPIYINIDVLLRGFEFPKAAALAEQSRAAFAALESLPLAGYAAVWAAKSAILEQAFAEFNGAPEVEAFKVAGGESLALHGAFEAKMAGEKVTPERIAYRSFLQWIADGQLAKAASQRNLYRDLALGSAFDGGEIAEEPESFAHGVSIGAPPDPFSAAGQVWNLPPWSPLALEETSLAPLRAVLAANMRHAAALRIDHILGFMRQFWVPRGAEGRYGAYVNFPVDAMIAVAAIESLRHSCMVVGEDLGTIPDGLRDRLAAANILSYRVLWFEREGRGFKPPSHYPDLALACLASHDLPTFRGWREGRDIAIDQELGLITEEAAELRQASRAQEIAALDRLSGAQGAGLAEASAAAHVLVASTPSRVMLVQADDLADEIEPLNVPGTDQERPNWRRRLSVPVEGLASGAIAKAVIERVRAERP